MDDNVISLAETDEELNDDDDDNNMQSHYLDDVEEEEFDEDERDDTNKDTNIDYNSNTLDDDQLWISFTILIQLNLNLLLSIIMFLTDSIHNLSYRY